MVGEKDKEEGKMKNRVKLGALSVLGVFGVSLVGLRLKGGGRPLEFVGFQKPMSPEGNFSSFFVVLHKPWGW